MLSPVHIITIGLGVAFSLGFLSKKTVNLAFILMLAAIATMGIISGSWLAMILNGNQGIEIFTAGFRPPFSINLLMAKNEAFLTTIINIVGFLGGLYLRDTMKKVGHHTIMVYLVFVMGLNVVVMTRDAFNLFVFMEIASIATAGMVIFTQTEKSIQSGIKYLMATGIISSIYLFGVIFAYYSSGTLNIDSFAADNLPLLKGGSMALMLMLSSLVLELKPFPANGWGIDVYESANPGISAVIAAGSTTALSYALYKMMEVAGEQWYHVLAIVGLITFVGSNLLGIQQKHAQRMLGYSSVGQIGLLTAIIGFKPFLGEKFEFIAVAILISHYLAKAGLFWISGLVKQENIKNWSALRSKPLLLVLFGTFIFMLLGFPPFPSFFGKAQLILLLAENDQFYGMAFILIGSLLEAVYLLRWLGYATKMDYKKLPAIKLEWSKLIPIGVFGIASYVAGFYMGNMMEGMNGTYYFLIALVVLLFILDFMPVYLKNSIAILGLSYFTYEHLPLFYETDLFRFIFMIIFLVAGILILLSGYAHKGKRRGFYPTVVMVYAGLGAIIMATNTLQFFYGWEIMTLGSYLLILRGKKAMPDAYTYVLFSVGGAYLILAGFALAFADTGSMELSALANVTNYVTIIFTFLAVGFMTKMATLPLHIWKPGAYAKAENDVAPILSAILLKAGVFGFFILIIAMGNNPASKDVAYVLGWVGALSILVGNMAALHQEDPKRLMAYSSVGQLGYILFGMSMMTHLGWMTAMVFTINHVMFKVILFLTVGAVVLRTKEHYMYKMGGLIKQMPLAFIAVLIAIIALSGIPPLSGFAGKWFLYHAIIDKHWYFQGIIALFGGIIAFLYLYKLIHSIFLGQLKDKHRRVKDMPVWYAIPVYIFIIALMLFSAFPQWVLKPVGEMIAQWHPENAVEWTGSMAVISGTGSGYWNATAIMVIVIVVFALVLLWSLLFNSKPEKIKQFNIVYSAEVPFRPETTHVSYNMFAGYNKALGWMIAPKITQFWNTVSGWVTGSAMFLSKAIYTGNGQTYVAYVILYVVTVYFFVVF